MRPATPELDALLATGRFEYANCFEIAFRAGGVALLLTDADRDIVYDGKTYGRAMITGARLRLVRGLEVDEQTIEWTPDPTFKIRGYGVKTMVRKGMFDRARVTQRRVFLPDWASPPVGAITINVGEIGEASHEGGKITLSMSSLLVLLNVNVPGPVYQASCRHIFGAPDCGVSPQALARSGIVGAGSTAALIRCGIGGDWDHGQITMTSGDNAGLSRSIKSGAGGSLDLFGPFPFPPQPGDTFVLVPGCDKTLARCHQFANAVRFGGQPYVPVPETGT